MSEPIVFSAAIRIRGINPYIFVSALRAQRVRANWRKPMPVLIRIDDRPRRPWRINMMPTGNGGFYLYLSIAIRKAAQRDVGDRVRIEIGFDDRYQSGPQNPLPAYFKQALREHPIAAKNWRCLIPSRKKEVLRLFARLKSDDARQRNVQQAIFVLEGNAGRFMARAWKDGK